MYKPIFDSKVKAQELVDVLRKKTSAPLKVCVETASCIVNILRDLSSEEISQVESRFSEDFIDFNLCYDSQLLDCLDMQISGIVEDKQQQIWSAVEDMKLIDNLQLFSSILENTDRRVPIKRLSRNSYSFVHNLVVLYQIEQQTDVRISALEALYACSKLDSSFRSFLLNSQLPIMLVINNKYHPPLSLIEECSLKVLGDLFSGQEKPPIVFYDYLTLEFIEKMLNICDEYNRLAFQFLINFNNHFDEGTNMVVQCLNTCKTLLFGQILIEELNKKRNEIDDKTVKMVMDIFFSEPEIVSKVFYYNDLVVLCDILSQDVLDSPINKRTKMILRIFDKLIEFGYVDCGRLFVSLKTLYSLKEIDEEYKFHIERILKNSNCN